MNEPLKDKDREESGSWALSDEDVLTAMKEIEGYIDITAEDFREISRVARRTAWKRLMENVRARSLMTREVVWVERKTPLLLVAETMARHNVSGVPVMESDGTVAGLLSEKDFIRWLAPQGRGSLMALIARCLQDKEGTAGSLLEKNAEDIMTSPALTLSEDASLGDILRLFREKAVNRAPVLNGQGRLAGIVTRGDLLKNLAAYKEWGI